MIKKIITCLIVLVMFFNFMTLVSAEIVLNSQPEEMHNLGSTIKVPVKIVANQNPIEGTFYGNVLCEGTSRQFYRNDIYLSSGEEQSLEPVLRLTKDKIGSNSSLCKIKFILNDNYKLTNEFEVSSLININLKNNKSVFAPEDVVSIKGTATREDGKDVNGFIDVNINSKDENISLSDSVRNGLFAVNFTIPKDMESKDYLTNIKVYEKDSSENILNTGSLGYGIKVIQIPTSLEISSETQVIEPGDSLEVKVILHDQTGKQMNSSAVVSIKDSEDVILKQVEIPTNEVLEYPVESDYPPQEWIVRAVSNKLVVEKEFQIDEKKSISSQIINHTLFLRNTGNVFYNDSLEIKIAGEEVIINPNLDVGEEKKYTLSAPDGNYNIEVMSENLNNGSYLAEGVLLTGKSISVKEASYKISKAIGNPWVWIFVVFILGFVAYFSFRKSYKKIFIGKFKNKKNKPIHEKKSTEVQQKDERLVSTSAPAQFSLSIKGEKHKSSLVCLKIENLHSIFSKHKDNSSKGNPVETIKQVVQKAEKHNAIVYETSEYLFFILSPLKTRTFDNFKPAYNLAEEIRKEIVNHNKFYKDKIRFGISLNAGEVIIKKDKNNFKFMSFGKLLQSSKKIASISSKFSGEIYLSKEIQEKMIKDAKIESVDKEGIKVYKVKELKHKEKYSRFISDFVKRQKQEGKKDIEKLEKTFKQEIGRFGSDKDKNKK
ncbi:MAG: hypothetical protein ACOCUU_02590 [Nanoarchaeota archaeon]